MGRTNSAAPVGAAGGGVAGRRAFHGMVEQIRDEIFQRRRAPGDRLPPEQALAEQFGISRSGVREATRVLELQGLIRVHHGYAGGVFVAEPGPVPLLGALQTSLRLGQVSVDELYQARLLFEPTIARLATEQGAPALAEQLAENVASTERLIGAGENAFGANLEFHAILARLAGNRVIGLLMQALLELLDSLDRQYPTNRGVSHGALRDHQQLLEAVRARDASRVELLMVGHLLNLESRFARIQQRMQRERGFARRKARVDQTKPDGGTQPAFAPAAVS